MTSLTTYYDKLIVSDSKHSDLSFEINTVNELLHSVLNTFGCDNKYVSLPVEV